MNNVNDIISNIRNIDNFDDMCDIIYAINDQQKRIARMSTCKFSIGDYVYFTTKRGEQIDGVVTKINQRTVKVRVGVTLWTVDALLLSKEPTNAEVA
jgi:hypothetical protein